MTQEHLRIEASKELPNRAQPEDRHEPNLTKISVARRQLTTAIRLLFSAEDLVSIYSLATNAWEVIDTLCGKAKIQSLSEQTRENVPPGTDLKRDYINSPYRNFFKHADRDTEAELEPLAVTHVDAVIFLAVEDYIRLMKRSPIELQVFQLWYLATNPEKLASSASDTIVPAIKLHFPHIHLLSRDQQLARGQVAIADAERDEVLRDDPRTELVSN